MNSRSRRMKEGTGRHISKELLKENSANKKNDDLGYTFDDHKCLEVKPHSLNSLESILLDPENLSPDTQSPSLFRHSIFQKLKKMDSFKKEGIQKSKLFRVTKVEKPFEELKRVPQGYYKSQLRKNDIHVSQNRTNKNRYSSGKPKMKISASQIENEAAAFKRITTNVAKKVEDTNESRSDETETSSELKYRIVNNRSEVGVESHITHNKNISQNGNEVPDVAIQVFTPRGGRKAAMEDGNDKKVDNGRVKGSEVSHRARKMNEDANIRPCIYQNNRLVTKHKMVYSPRFDEKRHIEHIKCQNSIHHNDATAHNHKETHYDGTAEPSTTCNEPYDLIEIKRNSAAICRLEKMFSAYEKRQSTSDKNWSKLYKEINGLYETIEDLKESQANQLLIYDKVLNDLKEDNNRAKERMQELLHTTKDGIAANAQLILKTQDNIDRVAKVVKKNMDLHLIETNNKIESFTDLAMKLITDLRQDLRMHDQQNQKILWRSAPDVGKILSESMEYHRHSVLKELQDQMSIEFDLLKQKMSHYVDIDTFKDLADEIHGMVSIINHKPENFNYDEKDVAPMVGDTNSSLYCYKDNFTMLETLQDEPNNTKFVRGITDEISKEDVKNLLFKSAFVNESQVSINGADTTAREDHEPQNFKSMGSDERLSDKSVTRKAKHSKSRQKEDGRSGSTTDKPKHRRKKDKFGRDEERQ